MRFRNVLVGIDGSQAAPCALSRAVDIARESGARLGLLGFVPPPIVWSPFAPVCDPACTRAQVEADAQEWVNAACLAVPEDVSVTKLVLRGPPRRVLLGEVLAGRWDLVVVGHRSCFARRPLLGFGPSSFRWPPEVALMLVG